ncbi:hypothetical protein [Microbacterium gilvum]|uniref:HNH endonuclease n=1 Tax=Microbacterium gilvum TaxID=1336204 RepID=A0ABP8ZPH2_9MICO
MGVGDFAPATVRLVFFQREGERCFRCRRPLRWEDRGIGWSAHHRKPRGAGGTSNPAIASAANLLILCGSSVTGCHGFTESHRDSAREQGLLIPLHGRGPNYEPTAVRVRRRDGSWWLLTAKGRAVEVMEGKTR